jgi:PD-(D/E)XK nuclease superfamily
MPKSKAVEKKESIEDFLLRHFEDNFQRIKFESGHGLAPEIKEAAKRQVLLYWRRLREVAESITDTEVRLNLTGQVTPKKRKFNIEGVVDIVREKGRTVMYDLKTHDPEYIKKNESEYERQLNVYAHIWKTLRQQELDETAVIATRFPDSLDAAWDTREQNPTGFEDELQKWNPIIEFKFNTKHVADVVREFGQVVDAIEDGAYSPPSIKRLREIEVGKRTFATRVCTNCDVRFSCTAYREYVKTSRSRDLPRFKEIYEDAGPQEERDLRMDAGLATIGTGEV